MKKIYMTLGIILMLSLVSAASIVTLSSWSKDSSMDEVKLSKLKEVSKIDKIDVDVGEIICYENKCYAKVSQKGLINTRWEGDRYYCSRYSECPLGEFESSECTIECLEELEYTIAELTENIEAWTNERLSGWITTQEKRKNKVVDIKTAKGKIKEKIDSVLISK